MQQTTGTESAPFTLRTISPNEKERYFFIPIWGKAGKINQDVYQNPLALKGITQLGPKLMAINGKFLDMCKKACSHDSLLCFMSVLKASFRRKLNFLSTEESIGLSSYIFFVFNLSVSL